MSTVGIPAGIRWLLLAAALLAAVHLLLSAYLDGTRIPTWQYGILAPPAVGMLLAFIKGDSWAVVPPLVSSLAVAALVMLPRIVLARSLAAFLVVSLSASVVFSMFLAATRIPGRDFLPVVIDGRAAGIFGHPNMLGLQAGLAILLATSWRRSNRRLALLTLAALALLASASQTALIATALAVGVRLLYHSKRRFGASAALVVAVISTVAVLGLASATGLLRDANTGAVDLTFTSRTIIWERIIQADVGLFGLDDRTFTSLVMDAYGVGSAHNTWLESWARMGFLGVLSVAMYFATVLIGAHRKSSISAASLVVFLAVVSIMEGVLLSFPSIIAVSALVGVFLLAPASPAAPVARPTSKLLRPEVRRSRPQRDHRLREATPRRS